MLWASKSEQRRSFAAITSARCDRSSAPFRQSLSRKSAGRDFVGNGFGKLTGVTQVDEMGDLETPILLTSTTSVPRVADALVHITPDDVFAAIRDAKGGPVEEGNVGAGTGTVAFGWKGGIGTASRRLPTNLGGHTVGVLVQTNFGGVSASNGSGDYAIAFSTAPQVRMRGSDNALTRSVEVVSNDAMSPLFLAAIEATEEAVYNSMLQATTMIGNGHTIEALPIEKTVEILRAHRLIK
jgi:D-aminopeptidase